MTIVLTIAMLFYALCPIAWWFWKRDTRKSLYKIGDRVLLSDQLSASIISTGGHAPFHGEVVAVRRNFNFRFEYDVIPDYSENGKYFKAVYQHSLRLPRFDVTPLPSMTTHIKDLTCIS